MYNGLRIVLGKKRLSLSRSPIVFVQNSVNYQDVSSKLSYSSFINCIIIQLMISVTSTCFYYKRTA